MRRAELLPLQSIIDRQLYQDHSAANPLPIPFKQPFKVDMWIPGRPRAKGRAQPGVTKTGRPFLHTGPDEKLKEDYVRETFLDSLDRLYPERVRYLPMLKGHGCCDVDVYAFMPPPEHFYTDLPHTGPPDRDNVLKLVMDALSGRAAGRPPLAFQDDSLVRGGSTTKRYWDPAFQSALGYPPGPGTYVVMSFHPIPRNPAWLLDVCPSCGRDDFTSKAQFVRHCKQHLNDSRLVYNPQEES